MKLSRGFSLLEVMLALVVVAIGISVLLAFSASSHRETANKAVGNDYSVIVNQVLEDFVNEVEACNSGTVASCSSLDNVQNKSVYDYLSQKHTAIPQKEALAATGITITITSKRSDVA